MGNPRRKCQSSEQSSEQCTCVACALLWLGSGNGGYLLLVLYKLESFPDLASCRLSWVCCFLEWQQSFVGGSGTPFGWTEIMSDLREISFITLYLYLGVWKDRN